MLWRAVYLFSVAARGLLALADLYIHPDEHFQGLEVVARLLGSKTSVPWEYGTMAARSYAPLFLWYYPAMYLLLRALLLPVQTWYVVRLQFALVLWLVTDWCLHRMLPTKQERFKAVFFVATSYVSLVHQLHCFSNSIETVYVVVAVYVINELRSGAPHVRRLGAVLGTVAALGLFNRVTFPVYCVLPAWFVLERLLKHKMLPLCILLPFVAVSVASIVVDSLMYSTTWSQILAAPFFWGQYTVTPLNNLRYNTNTDNLAAHGLHPRYTHLLVNMPQLFGPGLVFLLYNFRNRYWRTTPFLLAAGAVLLLSAVPHQELRFLLPVVPLFCCCFDVEVSKRHFNKLLGLWLVFNCFMATLMGVFHQGGVVPALDHLRDTPQPQIWWRTYSPPTWMLGPRHIVHDAMGADAGVVCAMAREQNALVVAPVASAHLLPGFRRVWLYRSHLDLDHLEVGLEPGLGVYRL